MSSVQMLRLPHIPCSAHAQSDTPDRCRLLLHGVGETRPHSHASELVTHRASCVASSMTSVSGVGGASDQAQKDQRHGKSPLWKPCAFLRQGNSNTGVRRTANWIQRFAGSFATGSSKAACSVIQAKTRS